MSSCRQNDNLLLLDIVENNKHFYFLNSTIVLSANIINGFKLLQHSNIYAIIVNSENRFTVGYPPCVHVH